MRLVTDASVLLAVIADEPEKARLIEQTAGRELVAPHSVHWEVGNAFSAMLRRKRTTLELALRALEVYRNIPIRFLDVDLAESLRLAAELNLYAYDAYLVRCSIQYRLPLISLDRKLLAAARSAGARIVEVIP